MIFSKDQNKNGEEFQQYMAVNSSVNFDTLLPYLKTAEREFLDKLVGTEIKKMIQDYYDSTLVTGSGSGSSSESSSGTAAPSGELMAELLELSQRAVLNLAYLKGWPVLSIELNNNGASRYESEEKKTLYKRQEDALTDSFKLDGFGSMDAIILFLEENIKDFPSFKTTDYYTYTQLSLVKTTQDFQQVVDINHSGLVFRRLRPYIRLAEKFHIQKTMGKDLYAELLGMNNTPDAEGSGSGSSSGETIEDWKLKALELCKEAIPWIAMAEAVNTYGQKITDNGFFYFGKESVANDSSKAEALKAETQKATSKSYMSNGYKYLLDAKGLIPLEEGETSTGSTYPHNRDNTDKKTFWA